MNRILILIASTAMSAIAVSSACLAADDDFYAGLSRESGPQWADIGLRSPFTAEGQRAWLQSSLL